MKVIAYQRLKDIARRKQTFVRYQGIKSRTEVAKMLGCDYRLIPRYTKAICLAGIKDFVDSYRAAYGKVDYTGGLNSYQAWCLKQFLRIVRQLPKKSESVKCAQNFVKAHKQYFTMNAYMSELVTLPEADSDRSGEVEVLPPED
jgi:hypothetical protein